MRLASRFTIAALLFATSLLMSTQTYAVPVSVDVRDASGGSLSATQKWSWFKNSDGVQVLTSIVQVELTGNLQSANAIKFGGETTRGKVANGKALFRTYSIKDKFAVGGPSGKGILTSALRVPAGTVVDSGCKDLQLRLRPIDDKFPFYIGTACTGKSVQDLAISLTFPTESQLVKSSQFESKGKGETWRYYELGNVKAAAGEFANFTIRYNNKNYQFVLESLKSEAGKDKQLPDSRVHFGLGLNYSMLTLQGVDVNASDAKPGLTLKVPSFVLLRPVRVGLDFETALSLSTATDKSITYTQLQMYLAYRVIDTKLKIEPRGYFVISDTQNSGSRAGLKHSNLGAGAWFDYGFSDKLDVSLEALMASFGSKVVTSHMCIMLEAHYQSAGVMQYGVGAKIQNYNATDVTGAATKLGQTIVYGLVIF